MKKVVFLLVLSISVSLVYSSPKDIGKFVNSSNKMMDSIVSTNKKDKEKSNKVNAKKTFKMDFSKRDLPKSEKEFKTLWHTPPVSQGSTSTCWSFSTSSFIESEIKRLNAKEIKISEMYNVYWEYVEKTKAFVNQRGNMNFSEGSQSNAVIRVLMEHGCLPESEYEGKTSTCTFHEHGVMHNEIDSYLQNIKKTNAWDESAVINTVMSIMNHYMGVPPATVNFEGKSLTPGQYMRNIAGINPEDYVNIFSMMQAPYYTKTEYDVPDNWWHSNDYYNVPLDDFMNSLKVNVENGYSMFIAGDVSEAGIDGNEDVALIPSFDIPTEYIDENARQFRYSNGSTTDDHGVHIVGYDKRKDGYWFLIKDSGSSGFNGLSKGYYYFHEDYIKLKITYFMVHKSAVQNLLKKFAN